MPADASKAGIDGAGDRAGSLAGHVAWSTLANLLGKMVTLGVWFFLTPFILHEVGATQFGLWALIGSVTAYGVLLDLGVGSAVTKYVAESYARRDGAAARRVVATAFWLYVLLGLLVALAAVLLAPLVPRLFNIPPAERETAEWLTIASGLAVAVELPTSTNYSVLRGLQRFPTINLISAGATICLALAIVVVLKAGGGLVGIVAASVVVTIVAQIPMVILIRRTIPEIGFRLRDADRRQARSIMSFSFAVFVIDAGAKIGTKTDELVIGAVLPVSRVAPYAIARRLSSLPALLAAQFEAVLLPLASDFEARTEHDRLRELAVAGTRLTLVSFLPLACGVVVLAGPFLSAWVGPSYADDADLVVILVGAGFLAMSIWPVSSVLQAMTRHRPLAAFALGTALLNLGMSIALVHPLGVTGVALGTLIATALEVFCLVVPYATRTIGISASVVLKEIVGPAVLPVFPAFAVLLVLRILITPGSLFSVIAIILLGAGVYVGCYLAVCARPGEKEAVRSLTANALRLTRPAR